MNRTGRPRIEAGPDGEELADLELEVGSRDLAGEVGPEVAALDNPVELSERDARRDHLAETARAGRGRSGPITTGGVALESGAHRRPTPGRRNTDGDQEDRPAATAATASVIGSMVCLLASLSN